MEPNTIKKVECFGLSIRDIPEKVIEKAIAIIDSLHAGNPWSTVTGAKKLIQDSQTLSVPLGGSADWRMLCAILSEGIVPYEILSHADYNKRLSQLKKGRAILFNPDKVKKACECFLQLLQGGELNMASDKSERMIKVFDNAGTVYVFSVSKKNSSSMTQIMEHGKLLAYKKKDSEFYYSAEGEQVPDEETSEFSMLKMMTLSNGAEKQAFNTYTNTKIKYHSNYAKIRATQLPEKKVERKALPKVEAKIQPAKEEINKAIADRIEGLRTLAKNADMNAIFTCLLNRSRKVANPQTASNLMLYTEKHLNKSLTKKDIMRFFMELQRLGFGKYSPGAKNSRGWISEKNMKFTWINCIPETVAQYAVDLKVMVNPIFIIAPTTLSLLIPTLNREEVESIVLEEVETPVETPELKPEAQQELQLETEQQAVEEVEAPAEPEVKQDVDAIYSNLVQEIMLEYIDAKNIGHVELYKDVFDVVRHRLPAGVRWDFDISQTITGYVIDLGFEVRVNRLNQILVHWDEKVEKQEVVPPKSLTPPHIEKPVTDDVKAWLLDLSESGKRGDVTLAWLTFHKLTDGGKVE